MISVGGRRSVGIRLGGMAVREVRYGGDLVWQSRDEGYLTFTAVSPNASVMLICSDYFENPARLSYSTDGGLSWSDYAIRDTLTLADVGCEVKFKARPGGNATLGYLIPGYGEDTIMYHRFLCTGVSVKGNVNSLLNEDCESIASLPDYCFHRLFAGEVLSDVDQIVSAKHLVLSADTIGKHCYDSMFMNQGALADAPDIQATHFGESCCCDMFRGCNHLVSGPDKIAGSADSCCLRMFLGCGRMLHAPRLLAESLSPNCYRQIFAGCASLSEIHLAYNGSFTDEHFYQWAANMSKTGSLHYSGPDETRGPSAIPVGWTVVPFA